MSVVDPSYKTVFRIVFKFHTNETQIRRGKTSTRSGRSGKRSTNRSHTNENESSMYCRKVIVMDPTPCKPLSVEDNTSST